MSDETAADKRIDMFRFMLDLALGLEPPPYARSSEALAEWVFQLPNPAQIAAHLFTAITDPSRPEADRCTLAEFLRDNRSGPAAPPEFAKLFDNAEEVWEALRPRRA